MNGYEGVSECVSVRASANVCVCVCMCECVRMHEFK